MPMKRGTFSRGIASESAGPDARFEKNNMKKTTLGKRPVKEDCYEQVLESSIPVSGWTSPSKGTVCTFDNINEEISQTVMFDDSLRGIGIDSKFISPYPRGVPSNEEVQRHGIKKRPSLWTLLSLIPLFMKLDKSATLLMQENIISISQPFWMLYSV